MVKKKSTLKNILECIKKYRFSVIVSIILAFLSVILTLCVPLLVGAAIDNMICAGNVDFQKVAHIAAIIALCIIITALFQWIMSIINNKIAFGVCKDLRSKAFRHIQSLPIKYIDSHAYGDIVSRITADAEQLSDGLLLGFTQLFTGVVTIVGTFIFMVAIDWRIAMVVVLLTPLSFFVAKFVSKHTYDMFKKQSETRGEQTAFINELISGQKVVKAFGKEEDMLNKFDIINDKLEKYSLRAIFYSSLVNPSTRFINSLIYAGVGLAGALITVSGGITVGALTSFLSYTNQYTKPFNEISGVIAEMQNAIACAARIFELLDEKCEKETGSEVIIPDANGKIKVNNVSFSYSPEKPLIRNFNLNVNPGERIAIVGPTGCGKTTLINLLMRFYDVNSGEILIDDIEIKDYKRQELRKRFGMVLQDTWLKTGTIKENIKIAKPDASDEEIVAAAKAAHAHGFIRRLSNGYDTIITENDGTLSQGQKQLLCIARVMLKLPPMLILDEATSSIDTRTEMKIQNAFSDMMKGRTSFIVAHRLSTIKEADKILVMKDGSIVEQGNHEELLAKQGFYANLYNSQFAH